MNTQPERDATADALNRLTANGSDLSRPMEMDFFAAFTSKQQADLFASELEQSGLAVSPEIKFELSVEKDEEDNSWTCYVTTTIVPLLETVFEIEQKLDHLARRHKGHADGFGSYGNAPED